MSRLRYKVVKAFLKPPRWVLDRNKDCQLPQFRKLCAGGYEPLFNNFTTFAFAVMGVSIVSGAILGLGKREPYPA